MLSLLETARDFFHLLESVGKTENIKKFVNVWLLKDPIQKIETTICGPFPLYFYKHLFFLDENRKLHLCKEPTNLAFETLPNKLFTLDRDKN